MKYFITIEAPSSLLDSCIDSRQEQRFLVV
jgi:hypothetical protein